MGWMNYYRLLEQYDGDLSKASKAEMKAAAKSNPNDAYSARQLAEGKWLQEKQRRLDDARRLDISFRDTMF